MANTYTNTGEHYLPVPSITDKFSYSRDVQDLRKLVSKAMESLAAFDSNADNYMLASGNAGTIISSADTAPRGRVASITGGGDATLLFQDNDGATLTDKWVMGYDDGGNGFILNDAATPNAIFTNNRVSVTGTSFRIATADSNATPSLSDLVVEGNTNIGIVLLTPNGDDSSIQFGDVSDSVSAQIQFNGGTQDLRVGTYTTGGELKLYSDNGVVAATFQSDQDAYFTGRVNVQDGAAGSWTANAGADELVIEGAGVTGISIGSPDANASRVWFGSPGDNVGAQLQWTYGAGGATTEFKVGTYIGGGDLLLQSGNAVTALTLDGSQNAAFAGKIGVGVVPLYNLHIQGGAGSGAAAPGSSYDDIHIDLGYTGGLSIHTPDASNANIVLGNVTDTTSGLIQWNGAANRLDIGGYASGSELRLRSDTGVLAMTIGSDQRISIGTTSQGGKLKIDQSSSTASISVLTLDQGDIDQEFVSYRGTSTSANLTRSLVIEASVSTATRIGFHMVHVIDETATGSGGLTDADYFVPLYSLA